MAVVAFALPILPGQEEVVRRMGEVVSGSEELRAGYEESRANLGISEEKVWVQRTPIGQSLIVYWETEDSQRTLREMANSREEFDKEFKQMIENTAPAIDFSKENPLSTELLFEWQQHFEVPRTLEGTTRLPRNTLFIGVPKRPVFRTRSSAACCSAYPHM